MTWDYRLMKKKVSKEEHFEIYEVYFDKKQNIEFVSGPHMPFGDTLQEIKDDIKQMMQALKKPVLDYDKVVKKLEKKYELKGWKKKREKEKKGGISLEELKKRLK